MKILEPHNLNREILFTGSVCSLKGLIISLFLIFFVYACHQDKATIAAMINSPKINDVYEVKIRPQPHDIYDKSIDGDLFYTLYKVDRIDGNTLYLKESKYVSTAYSDLENFKKLRNSQFESKVRLVRSKENLQLLLQRGEIINIERGLW